VVWDSDQYWKKAVRYAEIASQVERDKWERPFWLSLALEFLARAALTSVHAALNADPEGDGVNILYAFGFEVKGQPKSLPIHAVLLRLQKILPDSFTEPRRKFCDYFSNLRNQELHTSELPLEALSETKWLARYYDVCQILCTHLKKNLSDLFGREEAKTAVELIKALKADKTSAVKTKIAAHRRVFDDKPPQQREQLAAEQELLARSWYGTRTRTTCPACGCKARLAGTVERESKPIYDEDQLLVKNIVLANQLECGACGLVLADIEELHVAEIEPHFEYYEATELHNFHEPDEGPEYDNM
jgi:hypothetical protein